jgi:preprotein translocase subunit Sss1
MAKIKKPTKEDYEKQSKGQGLGSLVGQSTSTIIHV